jgi:hypothetical protein
MVTIPSFLLRKLYVRGSLCNTDQGVRFHLLNKLGAGYARRIFPLVMDGQEVPLEHCSFSIEGNQFSFSDVSNERPFTLDLNKTTVITVKNTTLTKEPHTIAMSFQVAGLGNLEFDFTDVPYDG